MEKDTKESTIVKIYYGRLGTSEDAKMSLYEHITINDLLQQSDKLTKTLSKEVNLLVNELSNQYSFAAISKWTKSYETGFQVGLGIGFECGKI